MDITSVYTLVGTVVAALAGSSFLTVWMQGRQTTRKTNADAKVLMDQADAPLVAKLLVQIDNLRAEVAEIRKENHECDKKYNRLIADFEIFKVKHEKCFVIP